MRWFAVGLALLSLGLSVVAFGQIPSTGHIEGLIVETQLQHAHAICSAKLYGLEWVNVDGQGRCLQVAFQANGTVHGENNPTEAGRQADPPTSTTSQVLAFTVNPPNVLNIITKPAYWLQYGGLAVANDLLFKVLDLIKPNVLRHNIAWIFQNDPVTGQPYSQIAMEGPHQDFSRNTGPQLSVFYTWDQATNTITPLTCPGGGSSCWVGEWTQSGYTPITKPLILASSNGDFAVGTYSSGWRDPQQVKRPMNYMAGINPAPAVGDVSSIVPYFVAGAAYGTTIQTGVYYNWFACTAFGRLSDVQADMTWMVNSGKC